MLYLYGSMQVSNRWLATRLETTGTLVVLGASLFSILSKGIAAGLAGLSITYALQVTQSLNWVVRMASDKENQIVAVERVREYTRCRKEPPAVVRDNRPPSSWPSQVTKRMIALLLERIEKTIVLCQPAKAL